MYHISDTAPPTTDPPKNSIVLFDEEEIEMLTKAERLTVLTIQQQLDLLAVEEKIEKEKNAYVFPDVNKAPGDLPFEEILDLEAAMFDDRSLYLRPKVSVLVPTCENELHKELVRKLDTCQKSYLNVVYQKIHVFGSRMTYQPHLELSTLERSMEDTDLSDKLKVYMNNLGRVTYDILVQSEILGNPIDFEVFQTVGVKFNGEDRSITTQVDLVSGQADQEEYMDSSEMSASPTQMSEDCSYSKDSNSVVDETERLADQASGYSDETFNSDSFAKSEEFEDRVLRIPFKSCHKRAAVSFLISLRQSVPIHKLFHQHLASMGHNDLTMYLFVCHLGPLVDNQVVLYEYRSRVAGQPIQGADINEIMKSWKRLQGRLVFPVTPVEDLVKHSIYRYEGLSKKKKEKKPRKVIKLYID
ncbi:uncharacterized protein [Argopecten irradians]|uniref:uncharacterized protein n=1 Tax=Argopecten irradians TaxID=31199 RepID=UPI003713DCB5